MLIRKREAHRCGSDGRGKNKRVGAARFCRHCTIKTRLAQVRRAVTHWLSRRAFDIAISMAGAGDRLAAHVTFIECQLSVWGKRDGPQ